MKDRLTIFTEQASTQVRRSLPKRSRARRLAVGLAFSGGVASSAFVLAYRWRRAQDAAKLPRPAGPTLLDKVLPDYQFGDTIEIRIDALPRQIFRAFNQLTSADMPLAWLLGTLRYLPATLTGKTKAGGPDTEPFSKHLLEAGFALLAEDPDREIIIGTIGKLHQMSDQAMLPSKSVEEFTAFADPGFQKLAVSLRVEPGVLFGEYRLILEHRTQALSEESRAQFTHYWLFIKPGGRFISKLLLKAVKRSAERYAAEEHMAQRPAQPGEPLAAAA